MSSHVRTHIYADERAREMDYAYAAPDRQMGCSPLGRMISKVIKKCNGRRGRTRHEHVDYAMAHPHAQTHYVRPDARTVTYTTTSNPPGSHAMPAQQPPVHGPYGPAAGGPPRADGKPRKRKKSKSKSKSKHVRFNTPGPGAGPPPGAADAYQHQHAPPEPGTSGDAAYGDQHHHHAAASHAYAPAPQGHGHGYGYGYGRYAPSPLTRWEMLGAGGTPRRHEYFSGEYRWYYPTPVREGIYSMATDANRLTAIFSEENPNACTIV